MASRIPIVFVALTTLLLSLIPTVSAANTVKFINHCPHSLYFWITGPSSKASDPEWNEVPGHGGSVIHTMIDTPNAGGISLKIRDLPHFEVAPSGILQAEYKLEPDKGIFWYDFSAIDCGRSIGPEDPWYCPFVRGGVKMWVPDADQKRCPVATCGGGEWWTCEKTYLDHGSWDGEPSYSCGIGSDVFFETCTEGYAPQTYCPDHPWENNNGPQPMPPQVPPPPPSPPFEPLPPSPEPYDPEPEPIPSSIPSAIPQPYPLRPSSISTPSPPSGPPLPPIILMPPENLAPYNPSPRPPTYPPPPGYPIATTCFDPLCICYIVHQPWQYPDNYPPGTPDCSGYRPEK